MVGAALEDDEMSELLLILVALLINRGERGRWLPLVLRLKK